MATTTPDESTPFLTMPLGISSLMANAATDRPAKGFKVEGGKDRDLEEMQVMGGKGSSRDADRWTATEILK